MFAPPKRHPSPLRPRTRSATAAQRQQQQDQHGPAGAGYFSSPASSKPPPQQQWGSPAAAAASGGLSAVVMEYVVAMRPWTFTASVVPIALAAVLLEAPLSKRPFVSALGAGLLVHAASNLANTYYDFTSGRDTAQESGDRALVDRVHVTQRGVLLLALALYAASTALVVSSVEHSLYGPLLGVYAAGALLSFLYTAWPFQLKCRALGDVVVYLCFGPLLFQFTALLVASPASPNYRDASATNSWSAEMVYWELMPYTVPIGLLTEAILHANNARDIEMDARAGTLTLARLLGFRASKGLFALLLLGAYAASAHLALTRHVGNALVGITLPVAYLTAARFQEKSMELMPEAVAKLHALYGLLTILGVALSPWAEPATRLMRDMTMTGGGKR